MELSELQPALQTPYLAGFFDGEGMIGVRGRRHEGEQHGWSSFLTVGQITPEPLQLFRARFGGTISFQDRSHLPNNRDMYYWRLGGVAQVRDAIEQMLPYLTVKRDQARCFLEFADTFSDDGWRRVPEEIQERRTELADRIRALKWQVYSQG